MMMMMMMMIVIASLHYTQVIYSSLMYRTAKPYTVYKTVATGNS